VLRETLALALTLGVALGGAASAVAEPATPSAERLARLADERGPIRRHLEEAFPSPSLDRATATVAVDARDGRERLAPAPDPSAAQAAPPKKRRTVKVGLILLGVLAAYAALYLITFSQGFDL
jgi:hypothetical protein